MVSGRRAAVPVPRLLLALKNDAVAGALANPTPAHLAFGVVVLVGLVYFTSFVTSSVVGLIGGLLPVKSLKSYGKWAIVTGATDGIGFAYARQLAKRGLFLVIISRSADKLKDSAAKLNKAFPSIEVKTIVADFSSYDAALYKHIKDELAGLEIGILINNVGMSYPSALYFHELDEHNPALIDNLIAINVNATTQMTRIVAPDMVKRKRGAIINISSAAGRVPVGNPFFAVYSGAKAYIEFFSRSLYAELKPFGITVQCQVPYFVATKMSKIRHASLTVPSADGFAAAAVKKIGRSAVTVPVPAHAVQDWVVRHLPTSLLTSYLVSLHMTLRRKFLAKAKAQ